MRYVTLLLFSRILFPVKFVGSYFSFWKVSLKRLILSNGFNYYIVDEW